jgi:hypothetical protein
VRPVWLYLHGFASGPTSFKGREFVGWSRARGVTMHALDLRVPSMEELRFSAMKTRVREAIDASGGAHARAVLVGSSLGGLCALRVAEEDPRVCAVFAMAPAFRLAARWRARLGEPAFERWKTDGFVEVDDHMTGGRSRVGYSFYDELDRIDSGFPDVRVPVCIVQGVRDDVVDPENARIFARGKPHVRLVEVDDGHELVDSMPEILREAAGFFATFGI